MTLQILTLVIVALIVVICWGFLARDIDRDRGGGDALGAILAHRRDGTDDYAYVWLVWTVICFIVISAGSYRTPEFLLHPMQVLNALNYVIIVPALMSGYLLLLRSIARVPMPDERPWRKHMRHGVILILAMVVLYLATQSEREVPSPGSPWVVSCVPSAEPCGLTQEGVAFYAMRGVDTSMALGLIVAIFLLFKHREKHFRGRILVDEEFPGLGPAKDVVNLGTSLGLVAFLGSVVTFLHGASLFMHAQRMLETEGDTVASGQTPAEYVLALFLKLTWIHWALLTLAASVLCIAIVVWLRERILADLREMKSREMRQVPVIPATVSATTEGEIKALLDLHKARLDLAEKISDRFENAQTWPLPAGAKLALIGALAVQIANWLFALVSIFMAAPPPASGR